MNQIELIFSDSGEIRCGIPHDREVIYIGRNGNAVERIRVNIDNKVSSFIYKPLTNYPSIGKEVWVQENISNRIHEVRIPKIHYFSKDEIPEKYWMILEDMGLLEHNFSLEVMKEAAAVIPRWHILTKDLVPDEFFGHSPRVNNIQAFLISKAVQLRNFFMSNSFTECDIDYIYREILLCQHIEGETVISHGDLYPLNIARLNNELVIIDWEYININSVYWDIYNLMDITSPMYRRPFLDQSARLEILAEYTSKRQKLQSPTNQTFIYDYHRYSALHSIWLLMLIEGDLTQDKFEKSSLLQQRIETLEILKMALNYLSVTKET